MKSQQTIQYALMCLQVLDQRREQPLTAIEVSRHQGVPLTACREVLDCLTAAGLIDTQSDGGFVLPRPLSELTALEVVQAMAAPVRKKPRFQMWVGSERPWVLRLTLKAVAWAERRGIYLSDNGRE